MAGIAGIDREGEREQVERMLARLNHRGQDGGKVIERHGVTLGAVWPAVQQVPTPPTLRRQAVWDGARPPLPDPAALRQEREPFALTAALPAGLFLARDPLGVCPLYYGRMEDGTICFASEVKALLEITRDVHEVPPGTWYGNEQGFTPFSKIGERPVSNSETGEIAAGLRLRLEQAVSRHVDGDVMGCWLSGGLDSSVIAALVRPHVRTLHTFAGGLEGAPDLAYARQVADYLNTEHHEVIVTLRGLFEVLPTVIYHLESFDSLLVRSSITNYLVARYAADFVGSTFSGEGADELLGGYDYLKNVSPDHLSAELADITGRLHNTALQRVDRSASAHGLVAYVPFLDLDVVHFAMTIPVPLKIRRERGQAVEKWILRQALIGTLPDEVLWRAKAKFWQGAGVGDLLAEHAAQQITDADFRRERNLPNGWVLRTKEELMYYRLFSECFGEIDDLAWMGRTKQAPVQ